MASNVFGFIPQSALMAIKSQLGDGDGYVTIATNQTITGIKTFDNNAIFNYNLYTQNLIASGNVQAAAVTATNMYPTNAIVFANGSSQVTAYKALTPGTFDTCTITVDANGSISSIVTGTSGTAAAQVLITNPVPTTGYWAFTMVDMSTGTGNKSFYTKNNYIYYDSANDIVNFTKIGCVSLQVTNLTVSNVTDLFSPTALNIGSGASSYVNMFAGGVQVMQLKSNRIENYFTNAIYAATHYYDVGGTGKFSQVYQTNTELATVNRNNGPINFYIIDATSTTIKPLSVSIANIALLSTNCPTASGFTLPLVTDNSSKIATTAWVQNVLLGYIPPVPTQNIYINAYVNINGSYAITIPTNCTCFDVTVIGTGGLTGGYNVAYVGGSYLYYIPATGGGAQVVKSSVSIPIPKQGTYMTSSMSVNTNAVIAGGTGTELILNGVTVANAYNGNAGSTLIPGAATTGIPYTQSNYGVWIVYQGGAGQPTYPTNYSPLSAGVNIGQLGGGNLYGGIAGYGQVGSAQNQYGQGQLYGSLSGPSYGMPVIPASPINYGGCIITWYINS